MQIAKNIKKLLEIKDLKQKKVAIAVGIHPYNFSKMKKGESEFSIEIVDKPAKYFGLFTNEPVHIYGKMLKAITEENKTTNEKVQLFSQVDVEYQHAVFCIIGGIHTNSKFQTFFEQNIQTAN